MRRIILAALAVMLLHAAPSMAAECTNLALASNGGVASASSELPGYPVAALNNGRRENTLQGTYLWYDDTRWEYPDWAQIEWSSARTLDRITLNAGIFQGGSGYQLPEERTLGDVRVQYWNGSTWIDVVGRRGQDNPTGEWLSAYETADGSEIRRFDLATPVTTTKIRALIEEGNDRGWSFLDEIEAYASGEECDEPPVTTCENRVVADGTLTASSTHSSGLYPLSGLTDGYLSSGATQGYWNDDTNGVWPDWVQTAWARPITVDRIVARIPLARTGFPIGEITLRRTRIQYWDDATSTWTDAVGRTGQDNPIVDWTGPIGTADGSETKTFDIAPVSTSKVRVLFEDGSSDGWSWLDELEVYSPDCTPETPTGVNIAPAGTVVTSTAGSPVWYGARFITDDQRQAGSDWGYWTDNNYNITHDWAAIEWAAPQTLDRIVLRGPSLPRPTFLGARTLALTRVQWWDESIAKWLDVDSTQDNPIVDWVLPEGGVDGSEIKQFDFPDVTTRRVRVLFEDGNATRGAFLEEFEAYRIS